MNDISKYLFEIGELKRVSRSGWWLAGIKYPETVAEHSFRTSIISYILAKMRGADAGKCTIMGLFHDVNETRLNDMHKVAQRYIQSDEAEKQITKEQLRRLPENVSIELNTFINELEQKQTEEAKIVHDADLLECLIQAREYQSQGFLVKDWIDNCRAGLKTEEAQRIADDCIKMEPSEWWDGLKLLANKEK